MKQFKITLVDYAAGNVWSVISALEYLGVKVDLTSDPEKISKSSVIILPGVGSFKNGMKSLKKSGADEAIIDAVVNNGSKILGICLGMQIMGSCSSEDGGSTGLGLLSNPVHSFESRPKFREKTPHVGFNAIFPNKKEGLFKDLPNSPEFYFTHSYCMFLDSLQGGYATCKHGIEFLSAYEVGNICGVQFHPEKSQVNGLILLKNFLEKI